jgi:hypothetical protein
MLLAHWITGYKHIGLVIGVFCYEVVIYAIISEINVITLVRVFLNLWDYFIVDSCKYIVI